MGGNRSKRPLIRDYHLWSEVTRSVSPLKPRGRKTKAKPLPAAEPEKPVSAKPVPASKAEGSETGKTRPTPPVWSPGANNMAAGPGHTLGRRAAPETPPGRVIEPRLRRKLTRGQVPIDATIDLHGLRQAEAHAALCRFVAARYARGDRTVLVITGKGLKKAEEGRIEQRGVLRAMLPHWLSEPVLAPMIAGWEGAARAHGGEGAYYVRLKRRKS